MDSLWGKVDPEPPRDLLRAPRRCPPSILSGPMTATDPAHLGAWHQLTIGAGDNATETILDVPAKLVVPRRASPPSDGRHADPNATALSWPDTPGLRYGLRRCDPTHAKSSTHTDPGGGRSPPPHSRGRGEPRSPPAQQKTNSAPKQGQKKMGPSRHSRGTNANQRQVTHQPPHRHPRSTTHQRSLPKTAPDAHAARPADDQATASPAATHDQPYEPSLLPLQLLTLETLRRPFESTQYLSIRYTNRLTQAGIEPSVGSVGDSYDNALAESVIGLYKTELIRPRGPWRNLDQVEYATLEYVDWFNHRRILEPIGHIPPTEKEANYHREQNRVQLAGLKQNTLPETPEEVVDPH